METRFVVKTTLNEQIVKEFIDFHHGSWSLLCSRNFWRSYKLMLRLLLVVVLAVVCQNITLGFILAVLLLVVRGRQLRRRFCGESMVRHWESKIRFNDDEFLAANGQMQIRHLYEDIDRFCEMERYFYLYMRKGQNYLLSKSGFAEGSVADFGAFISERTGRGAEKTRTYTLGDRTFFAVKEKKRWLYQLVHPDFTANTVTVRVTFWRFLLFYNGQKVTLQSGSCQLQDDNGRRRHVTLLSSWLSALYLRIDDAKWQITPQPSYQEQYGVSVFVIVFLFMMIGLSGDISGSYILVFQILFVLLAVPAGFVAMRVLRQLLLMRYIGIVKALIGISLTVSLFIGVLIVSISGMYAMRAVADSGWRWQDLDDVQTLPVACYTAAGITCGSLGWQDGAVTLFNEALQSDPQASGLFYNRAVAYKYLGDTAAAKRDLARAIALRPTFAAAYVEQGILLEQEGKETEALQSFVMAIACGNDVLAEAEAYYRRGIVYKERNWLWDAVDDFDAAIALTPDDSRLYNGRASALSALGEYEVAIEDYGVVIRQRSRSAIAYYNRGICYGKAEDYEKSVRDLTKAISYNAKQPEYYRSRGLSYSMLKENELAIEDYRKAIELRPNRASYYIDLGNVYNDLGQIEQSLASYAKAIELAPDEPMGYYNRAVYYSSTANYAQSIADYSKVIALSPTYANAFENRGNDYFNLGQYDQALKDFSEAIELSPEEGRFYLNRSIAYRKVGRIDEANEDYRQAVTLEPTLRNAFVEDAAIEKRK